MDVFDDGMVHFGGLEVLADGEHVATVFAEVVHELEDFIACFTQSEHESRFGAFAIGFGASDLFEATVVFGLWADASVEGLDGFHVVGDDFLSCGDHTLEGLPVSTRVGDECFDSYFGAECFDGAYGLIPYFGSFIGEFVAVDGSDHGMVDAHEAYCFGDAIGFFFVIVWGSTRLHGAKGTRSRAYIAQNHEGSCAGAPAFADVGTIAAFTDGVQVVLVDDMAYTPIIFTRGESHF